MGRPQSTLLTVIILGIVIVIIVYCCRRMRLTEDFRGERPHAKQSIYRYILGLTKQVLDELEIPFFLSSGTCLGYARERDFIDHDYDIDIGIFKKDFKPEILQAMQDKGLILYRVLGSLDTGMEMSFRLSGTPLGHHAKIDIFVHEPKNAKYCWYSYNPAESRKLKYCVSKFNLEKVNFLGLQVNVPSPVRKYLREHYGKDWRIPKTNGTLGEYHFYSSPISIENSTF